MAVARREGKLSRRDSPDPLALIEPCKHVSVDEGGSAALREPTARRSARRAAIGCKVVIPGSAKAQTHR